MTAEQLAPGQFKMLLHKHFSQIEARSIDHVKKQAKGLEMKIIELQQKLDQKVKFSLVYTLWCVYIVRDRDRGNWVL